MRPRFKIPLIRLIIPTKDGDFIAGYSEIGLAELNFPVRDTAEKPARQVTRPRLPNDVREWHKLTAAAVKQILAGQNPEVLPPLDLSNGTKFQRNVWSAMRKIRSGQTRSYGEIARAVGNSKAVRAVGGACGANPIPVIVPCHRVLAANNKIGGFSSGLDWKRKLLDREGIKL